VLLRWASGAWQELPTTKVRSGVFDVMYSARTPGFSAFAVAAKAPVNPAAEAVPVPAETPETVPSPGATPPSPLTDELFLPGADRTTFTWVIVAVAILAIVFYIIHLERKRIRSRRR